MTIEASALTSQGVEGEMLQGEMSRKGPMLLDLPGPPPARVLGVFGNVLQFARDPLGHIGRLFAEHGRLVCLVRGRSTHLFSIQKPPGTVLLYGGDLNRQLFGQHSTFQKNAVTGPLYPMGATSARRRPLQRTMTGLFAVNGDEHRAHRRLMMPAFHKARIDGYRNDMVSLSESLLETFRHGQVRDLRLDMNELTLRVVTRSLFGTETGDRGTGVCRAMQRWFDLFELARALPVDVPGSPYWRWLNLTHAIDREMRSIIADKRAGAASTGDMLSTLIAATDEQGGMLSEDELLGHTGVLFAAGHETTSNALCWSVALLSQHPAIAAALCEELWSVLHGDAPSIEQLAQLPLLDRVVKECLRLLPPAPLNPRVAAVDTELGGHPIPSGTEIVSSIYHTHRCPDVFPEPQRFSPARWEQLDPGPYAYCPFGAGPRLCIGVTFALVELKVVLAMLLQRFRLALPPNARVDRHVSITLRPAPGLKVLVQRQDREFARSARGVSGALARMVDMPNAS